MVAPHSLPDDPGLAQRLDDLLAQVGAPRQALEASAADGYLCGVLLQPQPVPQALWLPGLLDVQGMPLPDDAASQDLVARIAQAAALRHAQLDAAIEARQWFDPWVFELDEAQPPLSPHALVQPWVAGLSWAFEQFPALLALDNPHLIEPLAVLYAAFDPQDLEDAQELIEVIESLAPPADLGEAVEDLVRSVLLLADVSRPRQAPPRQRKSPSRRSAPKTARFKN